MKCVLRKKTPIAALVLAAAVGPWAASPALADPDLDGTIEALVCPTEEDPGQITVLGVTSVLPVGIVLHDGPRLVDCADLELGDRVKVKCADPACATAASVDWKAEVSAEGPVASADCVERGHFTLLSGVTCDVDGDTSVKMKRRPGPKPPRGVKPPPPTLDDLFDLLCDEATVLGTTPGTLEVKCVGDDLGGGVIDALKVHSKK
jgi:hypothetical protein